MIKSVNYFLLIMVAVIFSPLSWSTTAVDDVSVNYLTSFHYSGPAGWPNTGWPYSPPYYNEERDELIGINQAGDTRRVTWAMRPSNSHYYNVSEGVTSTTGLVKHPTEEKLYFSRYTYVPADGDRSAFRATEIMTVDTDGANPESVYPPDLPPYILSVNARPVFDDKQRLYVVDDNFEGVARLVQLDQASQLRVIHEFAPGPEGQIPSPNGIYFSNDGWIYGLVAYKRGVPYLNTLSSDPDFPVGMLYKIHPDQENSFQILHTFLLKHGELPANFRVYNENKIAAYLIEAEDYLYGGTSVGDCYTMVEGRVGPTDTINGLLCGGRYRLHDASGSDKGRLLIETPVPHYDGPNPHGSLYRIKKDGSDFTILHTFSGEDGSQPRGPMAVTPDGYLYGTTIGGGVHKSELSSSPAIVGNPYPLETRNESPNGTIYRLKLADINVENGEVINSGFEHVHSFRAGINENQDGKIPTGIMYASNGNLYGTTLKGGRPYTEASGRSYQFDDKGTVFEIDLRGDIPGGSIVVSATPGTIGPGETAEITWSGTGISNCIASGGSEQDDWQQDEEREVMGSITVTPEPGTYYYTINCADDLKGGRVGSLATLYADAEARISSGESLEYGNGTGAFGPGSVLYLGVLVLFASVVGRRVAGYDKC